MPRGDRTGPNGMGPMTGRGAGYCAGYQIAGFMNPGFGGCGRGFGRGGGWGRRNFAGAGWGYNYPQYPAGGVDRGYQPEPKQELDSLKDQAQFYQENLEEIQNRIEQLEKDIKK